MRPSRTRWPAAAGLVALACVGGCGGSGGTAASPHPSSTTPSPLPKALTVTPRHLGSDSAIAVHYSATLTSATPLPTLRPAVAGRWSRAGATATFTPSVAYPPDTELTVRVARRPQGRQHEVARRTTPHGSLLRAEQILARLRYLPVTTTAAPPQTPATEAAAVYQPPPGRFAWRFADVPATIRQDWSPGRPGQVLRAAVIAFQHHAQLPVDGAIGRQTWQALTAADLAHDVDPDAYSFVSADLHLPQQLSVWVDGRTVLTSPVNGGVPGAPTPLGTYPVYERFTSTTMSGTNPDGSTYQDPGVPWVNYFSGGSAVHGFPRASYGSPQSVGCLELPVTTAHRVYDLIDYGTLVHVTGPTESAPPDATPAPPSPSAAPSKHSHAGSGTGN